MTGGALTMAMSIADIRLAVKNARRCEACDRLLLPTASGNYACMNMDSKLINGNAVHNPIGQRAALVAAGEVPEGSFGVTPDYWAFIAKLPEAVMGSGGIFVDGKRVVKKRKWTRKEVIAKGEVVAVSGGASGVVAASVYQFV